MKNAVLALCIAAAGCVPYQAQPTSRVVSVGVPFDEAHARLLVADGVNTVKGNAFMRQRGGGVVTCAGQTVRLIPATAYARARFRELYGTEDGPASNRGSNVTFYPDPPEYLTVVRSTRCDSQGNFVFERVADGEFFVATLVTWEVARALQGGNLMQRIKVSGGSTETVILSS